MHAFPARKWEPDRGAAASPPTRTEGTGAVVLAPAFACLHDSEAAVALEATQPPAVPGAVCTCQTGAAARTAKAWKAPGPTKAEHCSGVFVVSAIEFVVAVRRTATRSHSDLEAVVRGPADQPGPPFAFGQPAVRSTPRCAERGRRDSRAGEDEATRGDRRQSDRDSQASTMASIASATSLARNGVPRTRLKPVASTRNSARISFCSWPRLISGTSTFS
jgi:hypothetical protein